MKATVVVAFDGDDATEADRKPQRFEVEHATGDALLAIQTIHGGMQIVCAARVDPAITGDARETMKETIVRSLWNRVHAALYGGPPRATARG